VPELTIFMKTGIIMQGKKTAKAGRKEMAIDQYKTSFIPVEMTKIFANAPRKFSKNEQILLSLLVQIIVEIITKEEL
jgi:hypothetical protein